MKIFENVKIGYEIDFIDSDGKTQRGIVDSVNNKTFSVKVFKLNKSNKETYEIYGLKLIWFLSGKKTNRFHNYGKAIRIVNKWVEQ